AHGDRPRPGSNDQNRADFPATRRCRKYRDLSGLERELQALQRLLPRASCSPAGRDWQMATVAAPVAKGPKDFVYSWEGRDKAGKTVRGELRAVSETAVNATLRRQGI